MADGEIEVAVNSEGAEDASGDFGQGDGDGGGGGGAGGGGIGSVASSTGKMAGLLGAVVALLSFLEPVLKVLGVVSDVMKAFVAPLAMVLMRLLQPALRWLLQLLPGWIDFINSNMDTVDKIGALIVMLGAVLVPILNGIMDIWNRVKELTSGPNKQAKDPAFQVGPLPSAAREGSIADLGIVQWLDENLGDSQPSQNVTIQGGLMPFIGSIESNGDIEYP